MATNRKLTTGNPNSATPPPSPQLDFDEQTGEIIEQDNVFNDDGWDEASAIYWLPEVGDVLQGFLDGFEPFKGDYAEHCLRYFILAPSGIRYSMIGGQVFDKTMAEHNIVNGDAVRITYQGKREIKGGKKVNMFRIQYKRLASKE